MTAPEKSGVAVIRLTREVNIASSANRCVGCASGKTGVDSEWSGMLVFRLLSRAPLNPAGVGMEVEINMASEQAQVAICPFIVMFSFTHRAG
jgi:hypothetical protein